MTGTMEFLMDILNIVGFRRVCVTIVSLLVISICFGKVATASDGDKKQKPPEIAILKSLESKYNPVEFDHETHIDIAEGCPQCHHQHGGGEPIVCKNCHSLDSSYFKKHVKYTFLPCKDCHGKLNPAIPNMPSLKVAYHRQCFNCHRGMGDIGISPKGCEELCHAVRESK